MTVDEDTMITNPKRYGVTPELTHTTPASPGSTLDEILAEWADSPETMVYQLACDVEQLIRELAEARRNMTNKDEASRLAIATEERLTHERDEWKDTANTMASCKRKAERERDEARTAASRRLTELDAIEQHISEEIPGGMCGDSVSAAAIGIMRGLLTQRDEARAECERWQAWAASLGGVWDSRPWAKQQDSGGVAGVQQRSVDSTSPAPACPECGATPRPLLIHRDDCSRAPRRKARAYVEPAEPEPQLAEVRCGSCIHYDAACEPPCAMRWCPGSADGCVCDGKDWASRKAAVNALPALIAAAKDRDELRAAAGQLLERCRQLEDACDDFERSSEIANRVTDKAQRENDRLRQRVARLEDCVSAIPATVWTHANDMVAEHGAGVVSDAVVQLAQRLHDQAASALESDNAT